MRKHASLLLTWLLTVERMQETRSLCCELKNSGESHSDDCHDQTAPPVGPPWRPSMLEGVWLNSQMLSGCCSCRRTAKIISTRGPEPCGEGPTSPTPSRGCWGDTGGGFGEDAQETQEYAQLDPETVASITRGAVSRTFWDAV